MCRAYTGERIGDGGIESPLSRLRSGVGSLLTGVETCSLAAPRLFRRVGIVFAGVESFWAGVGFSFTGGFATGDGAPQSCCRAANALITWIVLAYVYYDYGALYSFIPGVAGEAGALGGMSTPSSFLLLLFIAIVTVGGWVKEFNDHNDLGP